MWAALADRVRGGFLIDYGGSHVRVTALPPRVAEGGSERNAELRTRSATTWEYFALREIARWCGAARSAGLETVHLCEFRASPLRGAE